VNSKSRGSLPPVGVYNVEDEGAVRRESGDSVSDGDESIRRIRLTLY
jgi:hypothetical protein